LDAVLIQLGFIRAAVDFGLYSLVRDNQVEAIIHVHVDDMTVAINPMSLAWENIDAELRKRFKMTGGGSPTAGLGMEIKRTAKGIHLSSPGYIERLLETWGMAGANPNRTPLPTGCIPVKEGTALSGDENQALYQSLVGSLIWLSSTTRPDLAYATSVLGGFNGNPKQEHFTLAKHTLRYLAGTRTHGIMFSGKKDKSIVGFTDSDESSDPLDRRSRGGYFFKLNGPVSWSSKKHSTVSLSSTEAEYKALAEGGREAIFLRDLLIAMGYPNAGPTQIFCDNEGARLLASNPAFHARTKHIDVRHHWIREHVEAKTFNISRVPTDLNTADILTKALAPATFDRHRAGLGIHTPPTCLNEGVC